MHRDLYSIIDIAYNPDVLQRGEENPEEMEHLIHLTLKFVEERCNLPLAQLYSREPFRLKGSLEAMQEIQEIQEIQAGGAEQPRAPAHQVVTVKDANQKPLRVELRIQLPQLSSVAECDLRVSKDDLIIEVPEKYRLHLDLPELVDEERTTATFHKGKGELLVSAPVPGADP
ncbi:PREDICTED: PIH1 domain-containing protein 2 [Chaetura pelagica]|uniref:PIH1 domain-containing protein 2 n=1 Tax=Chaetura pelagica TaxID=8897 RepID=UPI0005234E10|nr:PREDICTED: PIH1 domain-containing protein 2 [Chaetura pelagica]